MYYCTELFIFVVPVKHGTPTLEELEELGAEIAEKWTTLGRRLGVSDAELQGINQGHDQLAEKGYHMLKHWRQKKGSAAMYQALFDALAHKLVQRQDLAEKFCHVDGNYFVQYESNVGTLSDGFEFVGCIKQTGFRNTSFSHSISRNPCRCYHCKAINKL